MRRVSPIGALAMAAVLTLALSGCSNSSTAPSPAPATVVNSSLTFSSPTPASGATIVATGTASSFLPKDSGLLSLPITIVSNRDLPFAELNVYLYRSTDFSTTNYCGQNLPDSPTWQPFEKNKPVTVTITGFQVYSKPCVVTAIRAMFHNRLPTGLLTPPTADFTIAESTLPVSYTIR